MASPIQYVQLVLAVLLVWSPCAEAQNGNSDPTPTPAINNPEHPITEKQIRAYFEVCHVSAISRQLTHEKMEAQRKQLPPWYPQNVWDEIEAEIDNIDLPSIALPIYRKYMSEEEADRLTRFFITKPGQDLIQVFVEQEIRAQHAGISPSESHRQALAYLLEDKNGTGTKLIGEMTPAQRREAESLGLEYKRLQPTLLQIQKEYGQATIDKQMELVKSIVGKRQPEMQDAKQKYEATHSSGAGSNSSPPTQQNSD